MDLEDTKPVYWNSRGNYAFSLETIPMNSQQKRWIEKVKRKVKNAKEKFPKALDKKKKKRGWQKSVITAY